MAKAEKPIRDMAQCLKKEGGLSEKEEAALEEEANLAGEDAAFAEKLKTMEVTEEMIDTEAGRVAQGIKEIWDCRLDLDIFRELEKFITVWEILDPGKILGLGEGRKVIVPELRRMRYIGWKKENFRRLVENLIVQLGGKDELMNRIHRAAEATQPLSGRDSFFLSVLEQDLENF